MSGRPFVQPCGASSVICLDFEPIREIFSPRGFVRRFVLAKAHVRQFDLASPRLFEWNLIKKIIFPVLNSDAI